MDILGKDKSGVPLKETVLNLSMVYSILQLLLVILNGKCQIILLDGSNMIMSISELILRSKMGKLSIFLEINALMRI